MLTLNDVVKVGSRGVTAQPSRLYVIHARRHLPTVPWLAFLSQIPGRGMDSLAILWKGTLGVRGVSGRFGCMRCHQPAVWLHLVTSPIHKFLIYNTGIGNSHLALFPFRVLHLK